MLNQWSIYLFFLMNLYHSSKISYYWCFMLWGIPCPCLLWMTTKCLLLSIGCYWIHYSVLSYTTSDSFTCSLPHSHTLILLFCISVLHRQTLNFISTQSTEANLQHNRQMSHNSNNCSSVLPGVSLCVGSGHTLGYWVYAFQIGSMGMDNGGRHASGLALWLAHAEF